MWQRKTQGRTRRYGPVRVAPVPGQRYGCMPCSVTAASRRSQVFFVSTSKNSFLLVLPSVLFTKFWTVSSESVSHRHTAQGCATLPDDLSDAGEGLGVTHVRQSVRGIDRVSAVGASCIVQ